MPSLIIDTFNIYSKVKSWKTKGSPLFSFFDYVNSLKTKYKTNYTFFVLDGNNYYKKSIDESYKSNRKIVKNTKTVKAIRDIVLNTPKYYLAEHPQLEADDISYCLSKGANHLIHVSDDIDWMLNIVANTDIKVLRKGKLLHRSNFEEQMGFPIDKIPLYLFLKGDSKDSVLKPFRIKGSPEECLQQYNSIVDYRVRNSLNESPEVDKYLQLINPITHLRFEVQAGQRTDRTHEIMKYYKLKFNKSYKRAAQRGRIFR